MPQGASLSFTKDRMVRQLRRLRGKVVLNLLLLQASAKPNTEPQTKKHPNAGARDNFGGNLKPKARISRVIPGWTKPETPSNQARPNTNLGRCIGDSPTVNKGKRSIGPFYGNLVLTQSTIEPLRKAFYALWKPSTSSPTTIHQVGLSEVTVPPFQLDSTAKGNQPAPATPIHPEALAERRDLPVYRGFTHLCVHGPTLTNR